MKEYITRDINTDGTGERPHKVYPMPSLSTTDYWESVTDVICPVCEEGLVAWYEAGYVPGYRRCYSCDNHFLATGDAGSPELIEMGRTF